MSGDTRGTKTLLKGGISFAAVSAVLGVDVASAQLTELVVTARKRAESLQDIPLSVQAFSAADLSKQDIVGLADYANKIPSLTYSAWQPGASIIVFRGVTTTAESFNGTSSTALYLDEFPMTVEGGNPDIRLVDVNRLEAVSGPQPTTYGASSQSGTLKIVTEKPDLSEYGGFVDISLSAMEEGDPSYDVSAAVNIPLIEDKLGIRLTAFQAEEGGFIDNVVGSSAQSHSFFAPGSVPGGAITRVNISNEDVADDDINSLETTGARLSAKLQVNDDWSITAMGMFQNIDSDGLGNFDPGVGDLQTIRFNRDTRTDDWYATTLTIEGDLGWADFISSTGYSERDYGYQIDASQYNQQFNLDGLYINAYGGATTYVAYMWGITGFGPGPNFYATEITDVRSFSLLDGEQERFSQEIRLTSKDDGNRIQWMIGGFYEKFEDEFDFGSFIENGDESLAAYLTYYNYGITFGEPLNNYASFSSEDREQWAIFGELGFDITDKLNILVGARYFEAELTSRYAGATLDGSSIFACEFIDPTDQYSGCLNPTGDPDLATFDNISGASTTSTDSGTSTLITATYEFNDDVLTYFTRSEGFRLGGSNILRPASTAPRQFDSDKVVNYEIGVKSTLWDGRATLNASAFLMQWDDMQLNVEDPTLPFGFSSIVVNAGKSEIKGAEVNFNVALTDNFKVDGAVSYTDAQSTEDVVLQGTPIISDGDDLPLSPDWKFAAGAEYTYPISNLDSDGFIRFDYSYVGEQLNATTGSLLLTSSNQNRTTVLEQDSYHTGNLKFGIENDTWTASLAVSNIWDERANLFTPPRFGDARQYVNRPREFTINFRTNF